jgi:hypothetical protein
MDPVKVIVFVVAFLLLLLLGRKLSAAEEVHASPLPQFPPLQPAVVARDEPEDPQAKPPAVVGADLPFPIQLPALKMDDDGKYNRPEFLNYHFETIDLLQGPTDRKCFFDEFFVETRNPKDEHISYYKYLVATPAGLQRVMDEERQSGLYLEEQIIIVTQWDLTLIVNTAVQEIIKSYQGWQTNPEEHALPASDPPS